jgi:hypothetical protein
VESEFNIMGNIILEYLYTIQGYITFSITIKSGEFSGETNFCVSEDSLKDTTLILEKMHGMLKGSHQINDYDSDDFILFEFLNYGHLKIVGQVGGSHREQYLRYQFITDQTILKSLIKDFKDMITLQ